MATEASEASDSTRGICFKSYLTTSPLRVFALSSCSTPIHSPAKFFSAIVRNDRER